MPSSTRNSSGATPAITPEIFVDEVRRYMRDHAELNRLIGGKESSNRMIGFCMSLAIDEWNITPPLDTRTFASFPSRVILLYLTIVHLLTSVGLLKARNRFRYSDGGFSSETEAAEDSYKQWISILRSQLNTWMRNLKTAINIEAGWGAGVDSEYGWINGWYGYT